MVCAAEVTVPRHCFGNFHLAGDLLKQTLKSDKASCRNGNGHIGKRTF